MHIVRHHWGNVERKQERCGFRTKSHIAGWLAFGCLFFLLGCDGTGNSGEDPPPPDPTRFNLAHLNHLVEEVEQENTAYAIVHIYAEAPDYAWVADDDEGAAALDDAARAAVVYMRYFELTGDEASREKAQRLLRFVAYLQRDNGLFYNFVWTNALDINTEHVNSRADRFEWWAARGVWALGVGARVFKDTDPAFSEWCATHVRRTFPHLENLLTRYQQYTYPGGRTVPVWLVYETASDATSELLLGLVAFQEAYPDVDVDVMIERFAEGISKMQYGSMNAFPWAAHASFIDVWHGWGNSQTQALAEAGILESAIREAEHFYPRLLINGWRHSFPLANPEGGRTFEQIAYATRAVTVGLIRLYEATGDTRYAQMAGLAASWFTGNNVAGVPMYDPRTGRGYDGINSPTLVNTNAGAESTIEALFSILEVEQHPEALAWIDARGEAPVQVTKDGEDFLYRIFTVGEGEAEERLALVMNLTQEQLLVLEGTALTTFLDR